MQHKLREGEALFAEGRVNEAEKCFLSIAEDDPTSREAYNNLGVIAYQRHDLEKAAGYFMKSIGIDSSQTDAVSNLCELLQASDHLAEAVPLLQTLHQKYPDNEELSALLCKAEDKQRREPPQQKARIAVVCLPGLESFLGDIVEHVELEHEVKTCYNGDTQEIHDIVSWADTVWIEWANELAIALTHQTDLLANKRVICRLHSYEALTGYSDQIAWDRVSDLIFVAEHIKDIVLQQVPDLFQKVRNVHLIPNGVNLEKFPFRARTKGTDLAYLGHINYKKGPMLLLHAFRELVQTNPKYVLHMGGTFHDPRYELYFSQMIQEMSLDDNVRLYGWIDDVAGWLKDKQYIVCSSVLEGHPVSLMEAMACGIKPLIHNFVGARGIYPDEYIWSTIPEFVRMVRDEDYDSQEYRTFVSTNSALQEQLKSIDNVILGRSTVGTDVSAPTVADTGRGKSGWTFDEGMFSTDLAVRIEAVKQDAVAQVKAARTDLAETSLKRLTKMTRYCDPATLDNLIRLYREADAIPDIQQICKRFAVAALEQNHLDDFLNLVYTSIYSENMFSKYTNYRYSIIDEDFNAFIKLAANAHPLKTWVENNVCTPEQPHSDRKLRVGFILEGLSQKQAPTRNYFPLAEYHDRNKFDLFFYSRWFMGERLAKAEQYDVTAEFLHTNNCQLRTPPESLSPVGQVEYLTGAVVQDEIDILVFQTTYFVPVYNFIACLRPAVFQAALEHQQPECSHEMDLVFTSGNLVPESCCETSPFPIPYSRESTESDIDPKTLAGRLGIPDDCSTVLISVNRESRYNQRRFWKEIEQLLQKHQLACFVAVGLSGTKAVASYLKNRSLIRRIITPGYRTDVMDLLRMSDIYLDLFPSGGGSSIIEAMQAGLPIVCFDQDYSSLHSVEKVSMAPTFTGGGELVVPSGNVARWHQVIDRLIRDEAWRESAGRTATEISRQYEPKRVADAFFDTLRQSFMKKIIQKSDRESSRQEQTDH